jgi:hypothetical protein
LIEEEMKAEMSATFFGSDFGTIQISTDQWARIDWGILNKFILLITQTLHLFGNLF